MKQTITMEYSGPWVVKLIYFKASGKFYSQGEYISEKLYIWEICEEVREMLISGKRPGLIDGYGFPYVLVDVPDHPHRHPHLMVPEAIMKIGDEPWNCEPWKPEGGTK